MEIDELSLLLEKGFGGRQLASVCTDRVDSRLKEIFSSAGVRQPLCLIAVGGYGRGELAPFSDIDIMLFAKDRSSSGPAEDLLYRFWDAKLDISHSFRTPADCINESRRDIRTKTSLLEHRFIAGDKEFYRYFCETVYPEVAYRRHKDFVTEKLRESETRHRKSGDSVYMLEPNIKDGKGGLRDVQTMLWLAAVRFRIRRLEELSGIISAHDLERLRKAYDFLLKVRFCLHVLSRRKNDILSFEFHESIAGMTGFKTSRKFLAAERFMRYLYLKESIINALSSSAIDIISVLYSTERGRGEGLFKGMFTKKNITPDFYISKERIAASQGVLKKDPEKVFEAFYVMSKTGRRFSPVLREDVRKCLPRIGRRSRGSHDTVEWFMRIIGSERAYETLREMHDSGVLGRLIPEFGSLSFLVVYESYHKYTVDEHSLRAVRNLMALINTRYKSLEHLSAVFRGIKQREALVLSLLLHDIGKGSGGNHEEAGYIGIKNIIERFHLDKGLRGRIEFLVKNHTLMASSAFRREIEDPEVIADFADEVADVDNLDALYLLTYADMSSVSNDFWTEWKSYLLKTLYETTHYYLEGIKDKTLNMQKTLTGREDLNSFVSLMSRRYIVSTPQERLQADYDLHKEIVNEGFSFRAVENPGGAELTIGAWDRPGIFSQIVGLISSLGMNIFRARIYTAGDGSVIDKLQVSNWKDVWWEGLEARLRESLRGMLTEGRKIDPHFRRSFVPDVAGDVLRSVPVMPARFKSFIEIDNEASDEKSLVEFFAKDRLGLLYDVSRLMFEMGVDIISARINTDSGIVNDIFYVQSCGGKIEGQDLQALIAALWDKIA